MPDAVPAPAASVRWATAAAPEEILLRSRGGEWRPIGPDKVDWPMPTAPLEYPFADAQLLHRSSAAGTGSAVLAQLVLLVRRTITPAVALQRQQKQCRRQREIGGGELHLDHPCRGFKMPGK